MTSGCIADCSSIPESPDSAGERPHDLSWVDSVRLDLYYIEKLVIDERRVSMWLTVRAVVRSAVAY